MKLNFKIITLFIVVIFTSSTFSKRDNKDVKDKTNVKPVTRRNGDSCYIFNGFNSVALNEFDSLINTTYKTLTCLHSKFFIEKVFTDMKSFHSFSDDVYKICCKEITTFHESIETKFTKSLKSIQNQLKSLKFSQEYVDSKGLQLIFFLANNNYFDENCQDKEPEEFMEIDLGPNENEIQKPVEVPKKTGLKKVIDGGKELIKGVFKKGKNFFKKLFKCFASSNVEEDLKKK